jgi:SEC-C motif-containing protein
MRSRYSAFVLGRVDYLSATWHASTRPAQVEADPAVKWLGLQVKHHRQTDATHAEVAFVARSRWQGKGQRLQEHSRFVFEAGRWWYVDGDLV